MTMPQPLLLLIQPLKQLSRDHILHANQPRILLMGVVNQALPDILGDVCAVVVGLNVAGGVGGIDVEGVEVRADVGDGGEGLGCGSAGFEDVVFVRGCWAGD